MITHPNCPRTHKMMDLGYAEELKRRLRANAEELGVDLRVPANKWTLWWRCPTSTPTTAPDKLDFIGSAASPGELFALVAQKHSYMFQVFEDALILEANGQDDFTVREYSCREG